MANIYNETIGNVWTDLNTLLGNAVGTTLSIQNQSGYALYVQESETTPADDREGFVLAPYNTPKSTQVVSTSDYTIWVRSVKSSMIGVQEV